MDTQHQDIIERLQRQVRDFYDRKVPFRVYHGSTNSTRVLTFKRDEMVDVSELNQVLSVDPVKCVAVVETNVPMDKLVNVTLRKGLVPPVVTEFPGITVGGAIQGAAAETSSFKWGCFSQTVNWFEMVLGNGELIIASPTENADLFYGAAGSYGSLGLITSAEIQLVPAKKYVNLEPHFISNSDEATRLMEAFTTSDCDFIEWVSLTKGSGVVLSGKMSNNAEGTILRVSRPWNAWYYLRIKKKVAAKDESTISLPLKDYLFRYNRGAFWAAETVLKHYGLPFNTFIRFLLDPFLRTRQLYKAIQESGAGQRWICQDLVIPKKTLVPFLEFVDKELNLYPIGGCPMKPEPRSPLQCNGIDTDMVFNIGVYGLWVEDYEKFVEINRLIEAKTRELGGKKWFYAYSYYSEEEFWQIYDKHWYDDLRVKYHAATLPSIFERTRAKKESRVTVKRAALKVLFGLAKLKIKD